MGVRISLDGILLADTPEGWNDATIKSKRDNVVKGLFVNYTTDLTFWGDGFDYLDGVLDDDYCTTVDILIESDDCNAGEYVVEFIGIIQLTQMTTYNVNQRIIETKVLDQSYDAKIDNNKSIKSFVDVGTSKNGEAIVPVTSNSIAFFDPSADFVTFLPDLREGYRVYDCFRFIIDYMTDGSVDFKSDIFDGDYWTWMLFNGKEIRLVLDDGFQLEV